ncbi:MAG: hypothetical protein QCH34_02175 [Methanocalculus sp.]|nr:hypothetical protein [Methanocalculus sp.]
MSFFSIGRACSLAAAGLRSLRNTSLVFARLMVIGNALTRRISASLRCSA